MIESKSTYKYTSININNKMYLENKRIIAGWQYGGMKSVKAVVCGK